MVLLGAAGRCPGVCVDLVEGAGDAISLGIND